MLGGEKTPIRQPEQRQNAGRHPYLAVAETIVFLTSAALLANNKGKDDKDKSKKAAKAAKSQRAEPTRKDIERARRDLNELKIETEKTVKGDPNLSAKRRADLVKKAQEQAKRQGKQQGNSGN